MAFSCVEVPKVFEGQVPDVIAIAAFFDDVVVPDDEPDLESALAAVGSMSCN